MVLQVCFVVIAIACVVLAWLNHRLRRVVQQQLELINKLASQLGRANEILGFNKLFQERGGRSSEIRFPDPAPRLKPQDPDQVIEEFDRLSDVDSAE